MPSETPTSYYNRGSTELAVETPLTIKKLEQRHKLTGNSHRLVIVLVGLPARGKSFVARKLLHFLTWGGHRCKIFNVGKYRREVHAALTLANCSSTDETDERDKVGSCDANFFDSKNTQAAMLREKAAEAALQDMLRWLDAPDEACDDTSVSSSEDGEDVEESRRSFCQISTLGKIDKSAADKIAIFDATNSTDKRRQWILQECTSPEKRQGKRPMGVIFVESICDDKELLEENFRIKVLNSPDFKGMTTEEAIDDLRVRVEKYEEQYETITDDSLSYIKIFNLSSKLLINHIYGRMAKTIVPSLMAWHIGTRPVFLCRAGQTSTMVNRGPASFRHSTSSVGTLDSDESLDHGREKAIARRNEKLGPTGKKFSDALYKYVALEGENFVNKRSSIVDNKCTGTSLTGIYDTLQFGWNSPDDDGDINEPPFPIRILASTMPRTCETVAWNNYDFRMDQLSSLNPLDKGDFSGMELYDIMKKNPDWYAKLERAPFHTRFPGGESYSDLVSRLTPVVIDIEQQVIPTLVVSHISTLQVLIAYFRNTPIEKCVSIEVPLHTVMKFDPVKGGGWSESHYSLGEIAAEDFDLSALNQEENIVGSTPFWGDHVPLRSSVQAVQN